MDIEFDPKKDEINKKKHGISLGMSIDFDFSTANILQDKRSDYGEVRYVATGYLDARLHILCFKEVYEGIRVISFRKANKRERAKYEKATNTTKTTD